jgi:hypothetical protein
VKGSIVLSPGASSQEADIEIAVSVNASDARVTGHVFVVENKEVLAIDLPILSRPEPCISYSIDVRFKPNLELERLGVGAGIGDILIKDGIDIYVNDSTKIQTYLGSI